MPLIDLSLPADTGVPQLWDAAAAQLHQACRAQGVALRETLLLLPFAAPLAPLREALARHAAAQGVAAWLPRVETPQTLARSLGPADDAGPGSQPARDHLAAMGLMRQLAPLREWEQEDPLAFAQAVPRLVDTAAQLRQLALCVPPDQRAAWWQMAQKEPGAPSGPGAWEALLAQVAVAWAHSAPPLPEDRLWALRPAAWACVVLGGQLPLVQALLDHASSQGLPVLRLFADRPGTDPLADVAQPARLRRLKADDAEDEALATAHTVLQQVASGQVPLVLVAEDRLLMRRVRALLERAGLPLHDETGWDLSTTQAAARVLAWLRAAGPRADADSLLAAWKLLLGPQELNALQTLESFWRGGAGRDGAGPQAVPPAGPARSLWQREMQRLARWQRPAIRTLAQWRSLLRETLDAAEADPHWQRDPAALALRQVLGLDDTVDEVAASDDPTALSLGLPAFAAWVSASLAQAVFVPEAPPQAPVVVTPLARAIGRPFAAAVLAGTDSRWALPPPQATLLSPAQWRRLGAPDRQAAQGQRLAALRHLLRLPEVTLLRRRADGDEVLGTSPWIEQLLAALPAGPGEVAPELAGRTLESQPVSAPQPTASQALPARLSASTVQALRDCPYRFFARAVLRLGSHEELEQAAAKRDYGNWLHGVLHRFHDSRAAPQSAEAEAERLLALADEALAQDPLLRGLDEADLLPFRAGLVDLAQRYIAWLHPRDAQGWRYLAGEQAFEASPPALQGTRLHGRIDRMDLLEPGGAQAATLQVLDYKTGRADELRRKASEPLDDVQLAFYAALLECSPAAAGHELKAAYLAIDHRDEVLELAPKVSVQAAGQALVEGLAGEWQRLRDGAALPALGQGKVCDTCEARGLCRRDHWDATP